MSAEPAASTEAALQRALAAQPHLESRVYRQLLVELHSRGIVTVDEIFDRAGGTAPDAGQGRGGDGGETQATHHLIRQYAVQHLPANVIDEVVKMAAKREEADALRSILSLGSVSFRVLSDRIRRFSQLAGARPLPLEEAIGIRVGLVRHIVSDQLEFIGIAKHHVTVRDFDQSILPRIIGPEHGIGRIGGKAAGMFLAYKILTTDTLSSTESFEAAVSGASEAVTPLPVAIPESWFLRSDVIDEFLELNGFGEYQNQKYKSGEEIRREYPLICREFRKGKFPAAIVERLRQTMLEIGPHPIIVRSSSHLEDRFGTAFSGKYASVFLPNQGKFEQRMKALLTAIADVYASALGPDPLLYRREHNLIDYQEDMGVLIQKLVGQRIGDYFLPAFSGVAFSRNEYRWSPRIRREDGLLRIVMGLGTRAVERVGNEYPRMVALTEPTLRPESSSRDILRNAQRTVDVVNIPANRFESIPVEAVLSQPTPFPMLDQIASIRRENELYMPTGTFVHAPPKDLVVTFDKLLRDGPFAETMRQILRRLEAAYGQPVDVEFAHDGRQLYVLQCRVQTEAVQSARVRVPADVPADRVVFSANQFVRSGLVEQVEYVIYVVPDAYDALATRTQRLHVGRAVGTVNLRLAGKEFVLIGPGRWGSNDIRLGVPVTYADINHSKMLIEVARERDGYVPEVSFGTHFFQDLVESNIQYLPLYPDNRGVAWNHAFFNDSANALRTILPEHEELADVIRVIHVPAAGFGRHLHIVMDGEADQALGYLE